MPARLKYLIVLIFSILAIGAGLWPSIATFGALLAIGTGSVAICGVVKPPFVDSRVVLRRFAVGGGAVLAVELLTLEVWTALTPVRTVHLAVTSGVPQVIRVVYNVSDGVSSPTWRWDRYFVADTAASTIIHTSLGPNTGWWNDDRGPHPVVAQTRAGSAVPARWIAGGRTQVENCRFAFDEFSVGREPLRPRDPEKEVLVAGWLDSLSTWGIECRHGRLFLNPGGTRLRRTSDACYFDQRGGVGCGSSAMRPKDP